MVAMNPILYIHLPLSSAISSPVGERQSTSPKSGRGPRSTDVELSASPVEFESEPVMLAFVLDIDLDISHTSSYERSEVEFRVEQILL